MTTSHDNVPSAVAISDYDLQARQVLSPEIYAYFAGGAADEITLSENQQAWSDLRLLPRALTSLGNLHTQVTLFDRTYSHPIFVAPFAYQKLLHTDGELASAYACAMLEAGFVLSDQSTIDLNLLAKMFLREQGRGPLWYQLYWTADKAALKEKIAVIEDAGYEAIVLTVDAITQGVRDRERRSKFKLPPTIHAVNKAPQLESNLYDLLAGGPTWHSIEWLIRQTNLPILIKGILRAEDAKIAADLGCQGVIVSNHGGRTLDTTVPTAWALPRIRDAVGSSYCLLVDSGIRRGTDVLKAIALGANAVLVGKPIAMALGSAGPQGVAHVIRLLWDELKVSMALSGTETLQTIPPDLIYTR